jgi:Na+-transporting NADH:ubiquinone oxidoreductase subunit E
LSEVANIILRSIFVDNLALNFLLGMCTYLAVSHRVKTAAGLGLAVIVVLTISIPMNHLIYRYLLASGAMEWAGLGELDLGFLRFIVFIGVIATFVQVLEMVLERHFPWLYQELGIYLPLLTVNCAILGGSLFMVQRQYDFIASIAFGFGSGIGWATAILLLAGIRQRLEDCDIPAGLNGTGIAFVITGILALGFAGLRGVAF